jgi:hypothetical protein
METTIVQPGSTPSIYSTGHRELHDGGHRWHQDELRTDANFRALSAEVQRYGVANGDRINTVGAAGALAAGVTDRLVQGTACHTDQLVQAGTSSTADRICASTKDVTGALSTGFTAAALAACKTADEVAAVYAALQKQVSDAATSTVVGFKDAQATAYQIEGRTALDAAKNVATLGLQATTNANLLSVEATKNFYAITVEATKNAAAAALTAATDRAAILAAQAECCCELKALITAESSQTRALINTNTIEGLRAQLVATQRLIPVTIGVGA